MADTPFFFALEFSGPCLPVSLLEQFASQAVEHAGCALAEVPELVAALRQVAPEAGGVGGVNGAGARPCVIQFQVIDGRLEIAVLADGRSIWKGSRPLP